MTDLLKLFDEEREKRTARENLAAPGPTPDELAESEDLGATLGAPVAAPDALTRRAADQARATPALSASPRLQAWLADPQNAGVARDDVRELSLWEQLSLAMAPAQALGSSFGAAVAGGDLPGAYRQGQRNVEMARLANRDNPETVRTYDSAGPLSTEERNRLSHLEVMPRHRATSLAETVTEQLPQILGSFDAAGRMSVRRARETWRGAFRGADPAAPLSVESAAKAGVTSALAAPAAAVSGFGGVVQGFVGFAYEQEAGAAFQEFRQFQDQNGRQIDPAIAGAAARRVGEINAAIEFLGLGTAAKAAGVSDLFAAVTKKGVREALRRRGLGEAARRLGGAVAGASITEGLTELSQEGVTIAMGQMAKEQQGGAWDALAPEQIAERVWEAFRVGATVGGVFGAVPGGARFAMDLNGVREARQAQEVFEAMAEGAEASKTRKRAPGRFASAVDAMTANGPLAEVRIDAERFAAFFQERGQDPLEVADQLRGVGRGALQQALDGGGELVIPTGTYAAQIAATPLHVDLSQHVRMGPDQMTPAEVAARMELGVDLERATSEATRLMGEAQAKQQDREAVEARITAMVEGMDAFTGSANKPNARLFIEWAMATGERYGIAPEALLDRIGLRMEGPLGQTVEGAPALQQGARGASQWRGEEAFSDARLTAQQNKIVEMALNNFTNEEIAEEMDTTVNTVKSQMSKAKGRAPDLVIPDAAYAGGRPTEISTDQLVSAREKLRATGMTRGVYAVLAERYGLTERNVYQRLFYYDRDQAERAIHPTALRFGTLKEAQALQKRAQQPSTTAEEILFSPLFRAIDAHLKSTQNSLEYEQLADPDVLESRTYAHPQTGEDLNFRDAVESLREEYQQSADGQVERGKQAVIVIGHPGAGKSTFIENIAAAYHAAVADADKAKAYVPMYEAGYNSYPVHFESIALRRAAMKPLLGNGSNVVIERVGNTPADILSEAQYLADLGYEVSLVNVDVKLDEAVKRMALRFLQSGRYVEPAFYRRIAAENPRDTFRDVLDKFEWAAHVEIDANGPREEAKARQKGGAKADLLARSALERQPVQPSEGGRSGDGRGDPASDQAALFQLAEAAVTQAQADGYEGADTGEAAEWLAASSKGLLMDTVSRMVRADQLFPTEAWRGMRGRKPFDDLRGGTEWWSSTPEAASGYASEVSERAAPYVIPGRLNLGRNLVARADADGRIPRSGIDDDGMRAKLRSEFLSTDDIAFLARREGYDSVTFKGLSGSAGLGSDGDIYAIFSGSQRRSLNAAFDPDFASSANLLGQGGPNAGPRGATIMRHLTEGGDLREAVIKLYEARNLSTLLHEGGHVFLEVLHALAGDANAPQQMRDDWQSTLDWFGVTQLQWETMSLEQKRPYHEKWAEVFERYLMEGKAPSLALQDAFAAFKAWLIQIYKALVNIGNDITPEIRGVMDRLLATDEAIAEARAAQGADAVMTRAQFGGKGKAADAAYARYVQNIARAREDAAADLQAQAMDAYRADQSAWWKREQNRFRKAAEIDVDSDPAHRAFEWLAHGRWLHGEAPEGLEPIKLSWQRIAMDYPQEIASRVPKSVHAGKSDAKAMEGVDPDLAASLFDFDSGDELLLALINLPNRKETINALTRERMMAAYGDPFADGTIGEEARRSAHREAQGRVIETELDAIERATGGAARPLSRAAKDIAERQIALMSVGQIRKYDWFLANERRQAKAAMDALGKGDLAAARTAKHRQLVNFHLYALARDAAEEMDKATRHFKKLSESAGTRENIDQDYVAQIDAILEDYELKPISRSEELRRVSLREFVERMKAEGREDELEIDERVIDRARRTPFQNLTLEEARGLIDTIKNIEHLGRTKDRLLSIKAKREFRSVVEEMRNAMVKTGPIASTERDEYSLTPLQRAADWALKWNASMTRLERLLVYLDGEPQGPLTRHLWNVLEDAAADESSRMQGLVQQMNAVWATYTPDERAKMFIRRYSAPELGKSFTKQELITMAANWGTQGNRDALMSGYNWSEAAIQATLNRLLDQRDWQTVQGIWKVIGSLRQPAFDLHESITGVRPKAVEGIVVQTPFGTIQGQYFPLRYDGDRDERVAKEDEAQSVQEIYASRSVRAMTRTGHLKQRVGSGGRPVKLSLTVFTEHAKNVTHDIAYRKAVIDIGRFINDPVFVQAFKDTAGQTLYRELAPWIKEIANPRVDPAVPLVGDLGKLRGNVSLAVMGWKIGISLQQHTGYLNAITHLGVGDVSAALLKVYGRPDKLFQLARLIEGQSPFMRDRRQTFDRDVREAIEKMEKNDPLYKIREHAFMMVGLMDWAVSGVTWVAAYEKAKAGRVSGVVGGDESVAIAYADQAVRATQGSGRVQDLPRIMRSGPLLKLFTMFYNYGNMLYNWMVYDQLLPVIKGRITPAVFVGNLFLVFFVGYILSEMLAGRGGQRDDETEEERNSRLLLGAAKSPFSTIVGLRDFIGPIGTTYDYQLSPVGSAINAIGETTDRALSGDLDSEYAQKQAAMALGYSFGLPSAAAWPLIDYTRDKIENEEEGFDVYEALVNDTR